MKKIDYLIIASTETPAGEVWTKSDVIAHQLAEMNQGGLGLNRPRIDDLITLDGTLEGIIPEHTISTVDLWGISQGPQGLNGQAKYIAYVGGRTKDNAKSWDTRTNEQKEALKAYVAYYILRHPGIIVMGLNQVPALQGTEQPNFNVPRWLESIGIEKKHHFND